MSSAVHDLQKAILDGKESLTQLLRKTKLIAAKLNLQDVEQWVDFELNGYPQGTEPPKYREIAVQHVEARNPFHGWLFAGHITGFKFGFSQPIADVVNFSQGEQVGFPLPVPNPFNVTDTFGEPCQFPQRMVASGAQFKRIIDGVTNELLQWTIELEKRGIKGEGMSFDEKEKQAAANQVFNVGTVHGTVGNIINSQVTLYDYSSVQQLLIDRQIPKAERRELEDIMDELKDAPAEKKPSLLKRGEEWIVKHKELLGAAGEAVGKAIGAAFGKQ